MDLPSHWLWAFFVVVSGLVTGSFLSVVSQRFHPAISPRDWLAAISSPRSHCEQCGYTLAKTDLVPLFSYLVLKGRCRKCHHPIGFHSLGFEIITPCLFLFSAYLFSAARIQSGWFILTGCLLLLLADIDRRWQQLPDVLSYTLLWSGLMRSIASPQSPTTHDAILGAVIGYISLWLLATSFRLLRRREGLGYGDMKLLAALGAWCGWQALPVVTALAALLALSYMAAMKIRDKNLQLTSSLPFGPFLAIAGWYVLIGQSAHLFYSSSLIWAWR